MAAAARLGDCGRQIGQVLEYVGHEHAVEGVIGEVGEIVRGASGEGAVVVGQAKAARVRARGVDCAGGRVDAGHRVPARGERGRGDAAAAADLEEARAFTRGRQ